MTEYLNKQQWKFLHSECKFSAYMGGYKAGKTFIFARKAFKYLRDFGGPGLIAEPSYRMNKDLLLPELENVFRNYEKSDSNFKWKWVAGDSKYVTSWGDILIRTQQVRASLEGHNIRWFGFDEVDIMPFDKAKQNWQVIISKLTLGKNPRGFISGTNEGYSFLYEYFYKDFQPAGNNHYINTELNRELYVSPTTDNLKNLPDDYIQTLENTYDKQLAARYIQGKFVNLQAGQAYYMFDRNKHTTDITFNPNKAIALCWDFNATSKPMATAIVQYDHNISKYVVVKEFVNTFTNTKKQCEIIIDYLNQNKFNWAQVIEIYGDNYGDSHFSSSEAYRSDYQIIESYFRKTSNYKRRKSTKRYRIKDRVASLNAMFENAAGVNKLIINKHQKRTIEDLEKVSWKADNWSLDDSNENLTHISDAISYLAWKLFPADKSQIYKRG